MTENSKSPLAITLWVLALVLLGLVFRESLDEMINIWTNVEEYSHGFFIPAISLYLIWLWRSELAWVAQFKESTTGLVILLAGLLLMVLGGLATVRTLQHYAIIICFSGMFGVAFGRDRKSVV